jgi:hypothetical protein
METIGMSKESFQRVFRAFSLDPYVLGLISQNWYGLYESPTAHNGHRCIFIGTVIYVLTFSFNPTTTNTSAICLIRTNNGYDRGLEAVDELGNLLRTYALNVYSPAFLVVIALTHIVQFFDKHIYQILLDIHGTEHITCHGPYAAGSGKASLEQLTNISKKLGKLTVALSNVVRHQAIAASMVKFVEKYIDGLERHHGILEEHQANIQRCKDEFSVIVEALKQRIEGTAGTVKYLQERTQSQSSVVRAHSCY